MIWIAPGRPVTLVGMKAAPLVSIVALVAAMLAGCSSGIQGQCIDWISLASPPERFAEASLVVVADVRETGNTVDLVGRYAVRSASVVQVLKGDADGSVLDVVATSDQCMTAGQPVEYVAPDPLADGGRLVLYLTPTEKDDVWQLVVPGAVDPASPLPDFTTPTP